MFVQIKSIHDLTPSIRSFELVAEGDGILPAFTAGSHIDVFLENGLIRQYSIANCSLESNRYVIGVLEDQNSRGGSSFIHQPNQKDQKTKRYYWNMEVVVVSPAYN